MLEIRRPSAQELDSIVELHAAAFPGFFLTRLGPAFLRELYNGFLHDDTASLAVAVNKGQICGVLAGTVDPQGFFRRLRARRGIVFAVKAIPGVLRSPVRVMKKLWTAVRYKGDGALNRPGGALISSLAVLLTARRQSVGNALVQWYCEYAAQHGSSYVYAITDKENNDGVIRFYKKQDFVVDAVITKSDNRVMYRLVKELEGFRQPG